MALDPFGLSPGTESGREPPQNWVAPEGGFVYTLGHDTPGVGHQFNIGDYVQIEQTADFGSTKVLRMKCRLRPPAVITPGAYWSFGVLVDGVEKYKLTLKNSRTRDLSDIVINTKPLAPGNHTLSLRLTLVSA